MFTRGIPIALIQRDPGSAVEEEIAKENQRIAIMAGLPLGTPGATNMLRIAHTSSK